MEQSIQFSVHVRKEDLRRLYDHMMLSANMVSIELMGMFLALGIILAVRWVGWKRFAGIGLGALSAYFFISRLVARHRYLQSIPSDAEYVFDLTWETSGLTASTGQEQKQYSWDDFQRAKETAGYYYLFLSENTTIIVPKRDIPTQEACEGDLRSLLTEKLGKKLSLWR